MHFGMFLRVLRSRFRLIASIFLLTLATALVGSFLMEKLYRSSATLFVDVKSFDPVLGGAVNSPQSVRGLLATQVEVIVSDRVVHDVIRKTGFDKRPDIIDAWMQETGGQGDVVSWLAPALRKRLTVTPSNEGTTVTIMYETTDPENAARIANAFAQSYIDATLSLKAAPAKQNAEYFEGQIQVYRERLQEAQRKMSAFQQSAGIVGSDERLDIENQRLQELSSQLVSIQALSTESRSRRDAALRGKESMPEVVQNQLVQALKSELGRAEARFQEAASRLGPNHPQYQSAQAEVNAIRARLNAEIDRVSGSIVADSRVNVQREAEVRSALEAQRARVLRLKKDRDQLAALELEVVNAQKALDLVAERLTRTHLESQAPHSNVSLLSPAIVPTDPARPNPLLNSIVGAFVGLLLGVLAALSVEALKRPLRTADDLLQATSLPVLAVLPRSDTRRPQRLIGSTGPTIAPPNLRLGN